MVDFGWLLVWAPGFVVMVRVGCGVDFEAGGCRYFGAVVVVHVTLGLDVVFWVG